MPKTHPSSTVDVGEKTFELNVMPDVFDKRDLEYRPRLELLPRDIDARPEEHFILTQEGNSCTGHAVAAMINTVLARAPDPIRASPYMLYRMARRYDEFEGDEDQGSSLRGALKGWYYHGVLPTDDWPSLDIDRDIDLDPELVRRALLHPLGAFYRVNAFRLDDMQSAVSELHAVAASALIHSGWINPVWVQRQDGSSYSRIDRPHDFRQLGGHAFSIVGYNDVGFLVQNSWGEEWGKGGFATLPYEDWLESAFDSWVARPGVPTAVNLLKNTKVETATMGVVSQGPGPDLEELKRHVVNLGNNGRLSTNGRFISTPSQIDWIFQSMKTSHDEWRAGSDSQAAIPGTRRIVLYAHGGLTGEGAALTTAQSQLNWWLKNRVYPVTFAWQSGPIETLVNQLQDAIGNKVPFGNLGFDLVEQADRLVEKIARSRLGWIWSEMKENAAAAAEEFPGHLVWPPSAGAGAADLPGCSLFADRLRVYAEAADGELEVHLVGHSAGSIFTAHLLNCLVARDIPVASISWLAPAIRLDDFEALVVPHLGSGRVGRFVSFGLSESLELDDVVSAGRVHLYQKSILYLVSRALERTHASGESETPLLGMQRHVERSGLTQSLRDVEADFIWAPSETAPASRCSATSHSGISADTATLTSVMLRILRLPEPTPDITFRPYMSLNVPATASGAASGVRTVNVRPAGDSPVSETGQPQPSGDEQPGKTKRRKAASGSARQ
ncbi:MAG: hypothetical protein JWO49_1211 [Arthrobacter sp.]|nr:hypothetical protein [Arthrobacter sp.]MCU1548623.1 hypothetical protein [Arthrobacter sp.]